MNQTTSRYDSLKSVIACVYDAYYKHNWNGIFDFIRDLSEILNEEYIDNEVQEKLRRFEEMLSDEEKFY